MSRCQNWKVIVELQGELGGREGGHEQVQKQKAAVRSSQVGGWMGVGTSWHPKLCDVSPHGLCRLLKVSEQVTRWGM